MLLTTKMTTYVVMDGLKAGEEIDEGKYAHAIADPVEVDWVEHATEGLRLTEAGRAHLASF